MLGFRQASRLLVGTKTKKLLFFFYFNMPFLALATCEYAREFFYMLPKLKRRPEFNSKIVCVSKNSET